MTGKDLYYAISGIDERFLTEREEEIKTVNENMRSYRSIKVTVSLVACIFLVIFVFILENKQVLITPNIPTIITNTTEKDDISSHGGDGNLIKIDVSAAEQIPKELQINSNLSGTVNYLTRIFTGDQYSAVNNTQARDEERLDSLKAIMSLSEIEDYSVEYDIDGIFPYVQFTDTKITSFTSYFSIENDIFTNTTTEMTDADIINSLCENKYTNAAMQFIGLDRNNLFIYRETLFSYSEDSTNSEPLSKQTIIRIANYSDSPQELSLNLQSNYMKFWITENFVDNSITVSSIYGYYIPDNYKNELIDYISYDKAIELAIQKAENFSAEKITMCTITYNPNLESGSLMPFYKFFYKIDNENHTVSIPLAN